MFKLSKDNDLSVCALSIGGILESVEDFLQSEHFSVTFVYHSPNMSVRPTTEKLLWLVET
jgi:hypothetical protein